MLAGHNQTDREVQQVAVDLSGGKGTAAEDAEPPEAAQVEGGTETRWNLAVEQDRKSESDPKTLRTSTFQRKLPSHAKRLQNEVASLAEVRARTFSRTFPQRALVQDPEPDLAEHFSPLCCWMELAEMVVAWQDPPSHTRWPCGFCGISCAGLVCLSSAQSPLACLHISRPNFLTPALPGSWASSICTISKTQGFHQPLPPLGALVATQNAGSDAARKKKVHLDKTSCC